MRSYQVSFYNDLVNDQGKCCRVLQRIVRIDDAADLQEATAKAESRFAELEHVPNWRLHAGVIEVRPLEGDPAG